MNNVELFLQMHCSIEYSEELQRYVIRDHASQAGTFVNGKRIGKVRVANNKLTLDFKILNGIEI